MYPIYIYEDNTELPTESEYYVVSGNGIWFRKETDVFVGFIPVPTISFLKELKGADESLQCVLTKIPHDMVMKVKKFFVQVFKKYHSEACVILYYNREQNQYSISVPRQWNSHGSVRYIRPGTSDFIPGLPVGTIHSHCDFGAFHSGVDQEDESTFDGLHITFGDITKTEGMSVTASLVVNNMRCWVDSLVYLEGVERSVDPALYKILPPDHEVDYNAWTQEVDSWVAKVNVGNPPSPWTEAGIRAWKEKNGNQEN